MRARKSESDGSRANASMRDGVTRDTLHRGVKLLLDGGASLHDAHTRLEKFRIQLVVNKEVETSPSLQAALLTAANAGHRCCLGGVQVFGLNPNTELCHAVPVGCDRNLSRSIAKWGAVLDNRALDPNIPTIVFGTPDSQEPAVEKSIRVVCHGWTGGIVPGSDVTTRSRGNHDFVLSGVLAGALCVSECFQHLLGNSPFAMRRSVFHCLWDQKVSSRIQMTEEPVLINALPRSVWILGLGHLGQAYTWALSFLPYKDRSEAVVLLNDFDKVTDANLSTSMCTQAQDVGQMKSRVLANRLDECGFRTLICERKFNRSYVRDPHDPPLLFCGVDNALTRSEITTQQFAKIIEAGLGESKDDYLSYQVHSFPGSRTPAEIWGGMSIKNGETPERYETSLSQPGYQELLKAGQTNCGLMELASAAVGVPFVGAYVAAIALAESVKAVMGVPTVEVVDGTLASPKLLKSKGKSTQMDGVGLGYLPSA